MLDGIEGLMAPGDTPQAHASLLERPSWQRDAACREHPEVSFFPEKGQRLDPARAVCAGCLVRDECLDYALALGPQLAGVWAGTSEAERRVMLRALPAGGIEAA